jgi:DNA-binding MarR family transcriptional regulator
LNETEMRAWRGFIETATTLLATLDNELQIAHGLSAGDYEVLVNLSEAAEHSMRMTELAGRLHLSPSGMTRRVDGLVKGGLVERRRCDNDRRGSYAVLTDAGRKRLEQAAPTHVRGVREHFVDRLNDEQLENIALAISKIDIDPSAAAGGCDSDET